MFYNTDKCHHVHIGENTEASKYEMGLGDNRSTIKRVESEQDLGLFNDEKLNFREHITKKVNIANRNLGIIFRSFTYMDLFVCYIKKSVLWSDTNVKQNMILKIAIRFY